MLELAVAQFADALLVIPRTLTVNAAHDATELVAMLRAYHNTSQVEPDAIIILILLESFNILLLCLYPAMASFLTGGSGERGAKVHGLGSDERRSQG